MRSTEVLELLQRVSRQVIEPRFRSLSADQVAEKNPGDLVTVADREAERLITDELLRRHPGALVVGEEATAADPDLPGRLAQAGHAWLVDPVDGTKNFVHGSPDHAVMVAEVVDGQTVRGWIWQPQLGHSYLVERGAGVFCDGQPVHREPPADDPAEIVGATSRRRWREALRGRFPGVDWSRLCCGVDYPLLATGATDLLAYRNPKPWDHAVGALMATELGGVARYADGRDYRPDGTGDILIVAAGPALWEQARELIG